MRAGVLILSSVLWLTSCSSLAGSVASSVLTGGSAPSVDAELVVGQKTQAMENRVGDNAQNITKIQQVPWFFAILLALGWFMPSPQETWRGIYFWRKGKKYGGY